MSEIKIIEKYKTLDQMVGSLPLTWYPVSKELLEKVRVGTVLKSKHQDRF